MSLVEVEEPLKVSPAPFLTPQAFAVWRSFRHRKEEDVLVPCKGTLNEADSKRVQMSLNLEWAVFGLSRLLVPLSLFVMYRRGVFQESFQASELKAIFKVCCAM